MIELAVGNAGVVRISQKIVDSVDSERIADDHFRENRFPVVEPHSRVLPCPNRQLSDVFGFNLQLLPQRLHQVSFDECDGKMLVFFAFRQQVFAGVRKGKVADVVAEGRHPNDSSPVLMIEGALLRNDIANRVGSNVLRVGDRVVDTAGKFHDTERVLESTVRCPGVDEIRQSQLVDVPQSLDWRRIHHFAFVGIKPNERVNRVADFMQAFVHGYVVLRQDYPG